MKDVSVLWSGRLAMFVIYGWFGVLKVLGVSPAENLVSDLYSQLFHGYWQQFVSVFGVFEVIIGVSFLLVGPRRWVVWLFLSHMLTTFAPLLALPEATWTGFMVPTLIGQYIIKNIALLSLVKFMQADE